MSRVGTVLPGATAPPAAARPSHARPTVRHKVLSAKERAPTQNSASGKPRKEPSPVPDKAGDRGKKKHGNPNTIQQQSVHEGTHVLLYVLAVLLYLVGA